MMVEPTQFAAIELAFRDEARKNERILAEVRTVALLLVTGLNAAIFLYPHELGWPRAYPSIPLWSFGWCLGAISLSIALRRGFYRPILRTLIPLTDAALLFATFHNQWHCAAGADEAVRRGIVGSWAISCALLAVSGGLRLTRSATLWTTALALATLFGIGLETMRVIGLTYSFSLLVAVGLLGVYINREHLVLIERAGALNVELAKRVEQLETSGREVHALNGELQRQIMERSRELSEALASLGADGAPAAALEVGYLIDERYRIVRELGSGGMGAVYEVERQTDRSRFALKVLRGENDRVGLARFAREAQIAAQTKHPNVVTIVDVGVSDAGFLYIVMELVVGSTLRDERGRYGEISWALPILAQIADGLAGIHAQGVVHRDMKPANVLLAPRDGGASPWVKISDFGVSRAIDDPKATLAGTVRDRATLREEPEAKEGLTRTGMLVGTPIYMAPELGEGSQRATFAADVFSLGVIAFELLTRERPFRIPPIEPAAWAESPPSLARLLPTLPSPIATLLDECMSREPLARPTARRIAEMLAAS